MPLGELNGHLDGTGFFLLNLINQIKPIVADPSESDPFNGRLKERFYSFTPLKPQYDMRERGNRYFHETSGTESLIQQSTVNSQQPKLAPRESSRASGPEGVGLPPLSSWGNEAVLRHSYPRLEAHEDVRSTWLSVATPLSHPLIVNDCSTANVEEPSSKSQDRHSLKESKPI